METIKNGENLRMEINKNQIINGKESLKPQEKLSNSNRIMGSIKERKICALIVIQKGTTSKTVRTQNVVSARKKDTLEDFVRKECAKSAIKKDTQSEIVTKTTTIKEEYRMILEKNSPLEKNLKETEMVIDQKNAKNVKQKQKQQNTTTLQGTTVE